jgi:hypothetical protein
LGAASRYDGRAGPAPFWNLEPGSSDRPAWPVCLGSQRRRLHRRQRLQAFAESVDRFCHAKLTAWQTDLLSAPSVASRSCQTRSAAHAGSAATHASVEPTTAASAGHAFRPPQRSRRCARSAARPFWRNAAIGSTATTAGAIRSRTAAGSVRVRQAESGSASSSATSVASPSRRLALKLAGVPRPAPTGIGAELRLM